LASEHARRELASETARLDLQLPPRGLRLLRNRRASLLERRGRLCSDGAEQLALLLRARGSESIALRTPRLPGRTEDLFVLGEGLGGLLVHLRGLALPSFDALLARLEELHHRVEEQRLQREEQHDEHDELHEQRRVDVDADCRLRIRSKNAHTE